MSEIRIHFEDRGFREVNAGFCRFGVQRMSWTSQGGPEEATIRAEGPLAGLCNLASFLRYGVRLNGAARWWGFVDQVEIHSGGAVYQVGLAGMWNRIAVRYRDEDPLGGEAGGWQYQSAWADDLPSQALYGVKEQVYNLGESRAEQAAAAAATYLARLKVPASMSRLDSQSGSYALLRCRGWWDTLGWQFYREERGYTGNLEATGGLNYVFGQASGQQAVRQRFTLTGSAPWWSRYLWLRVYRVGDPGDNLTVTLLAGDLSTVLASTTVVGATLSKDTAHWYVFGMNTYLTNGAAYGLRLTRSGAVDANHYYGVKVEEDSRLGVNGFEAWNGSSWTARAPSASLVMALLGEDWNVAQIRNIAAAAQFIQGLAVVDSGGVVVRLYRDGKRRMSEELADLAESGLGAGVGMRLWVNEGRQLVLQRRPEATATLRIGAGGVVRHVTGRALTGDELPVGQWALVEGLAILGGSAGAPAVVWVERAVWEAGVLRVVQWEDQ